MRPRYSTRAIILGRYAVGEASAEVLLLTADFGFIRARAQGLRKSGAKLSSALQTLGESDIFLMRGKDGWRLSGALLTTSHTPALSRPARLCAGRVVALITRLVHGEAHGGELFQIVSSFLHSLKELSLENIDAAECVAVLRILAHLGLDAGDIPGAVDDYHAATLQKIRRERSTYIARINRGIAASGL